MRHGFYSDRGLSEGVDIRRSWIVDGPVLSGYVSKGCQVLVTRPRVAGVLGKRMPGRMPFMGR